MSVVGLDPATAGAAVAMHQEKVFAAAVWRRLNLVGPRGRWYEVRTLVEGGKWQQRRVPAPWAIGARIAEQFPLRPGYRLAAEGVVHGKNVKTTIALARLGGAVSAPLEVNAVRQACTFHLPGVWLKAVTGASGRNREARKARSLKMIPEICPSLVPFLDVLGWLDHLTDGCGVALHESRRERG